MVYSLNRVKYLYILPLWELANKWPRNNLLGTWNKRRLLEGLTAVQKLSIQTCSSSAPVLRLPLFEVGVRDGPSGQGVHFLCIFIFRACHSWNIWRLWRFILLLCNLSVQSFIKTLAANNMLFSSSLHQSLFMSRHHLLSWSPRCC